MKSISAQFNRLVYLRHIANSHPPFLLMSYLSFNLQDGKTFLMEVAEQDDKATIALLIKYSRKKIDINLASQVSSSHLNVLSNHILPHV
jgi:hypothetical protein